MALTLKRRLTNGTEEEIGAETLWRERDELAALVAARDRELAELEAARLKSHREANEWCEKTLAAERALAEARGFLASVLDCVDQSNIERLCRLADTISDWLEGKLAARPAPAECGCDVESPTNPLGWHDVHKKDCKSAPRADPRPAPACDCGFPWGGGLTAPKRHANDCATRRADPRPEEKAMTSSADCDCWFLRLEGRHYEDCNKGHKNPPRAEPPAPRCECAPEIEYGVRRHDYDCPVRAAERARAEPPALDDPHPDIKCVCGEWDPRRPDNIKLCWMNGCPKGGDL